MVGDGKGAGARRCDGDTKLKVSVQRTHTHISTRVSSQITAVPGQARCGSAHCLLQVFERFGFLHG